MWAKTNAAGDVMQNSIGIVIGNKAAFKIKLCVPALQLAGIYWHAIRTKQEVFNCSRTLIKEGSLFVFCTIK